MRQTKGGIGRKHRDTSGRGSPSAHRRGWPVAALGGILLAASLASALAQETAGKDLRLLYQLSCAGCHGADGAARTAEGGTLRGQDFTDPGWRNGTQDKAMVKAILKGKLFGWAMPGFSDQLTPDEAQRMVTEIIRTSEKGKAITPEVAAPGGK
jgi:mono/diheme cytochrome c family protein